MVSKSDVLIVGAGPAGSVAAALLVKQGFSVNVVERETFPRFSIGESLLPQCMSFLNEAGMLKTIETGCFQYKGGAVFERGDTRTVFDFAEKYTAGPSSTYQVLRSEFDRLLAEEAERVGANMNARGCFCPSGCGVSSASRRA